MAQRIAVLDFPGTLLGPAAALAAQGHEVRYFTPGPHPGYVQALLDRWLAGGDAQPCFDADLVVYVESFSDGWWALQHGAQTDAPVHRDDPLRASIHPLQLDLRLDALGEALGHANALVSIDMSDLSEPLHPGFLASPGPKLKRECLPAQHALGIEPFPFLYNPVLLALERVWGLSSIPPADPALACDGWFCGTIDHPRYAGQRRRDLALIQARHPGARFAVHDGGVPTLENLRRTQRARAVLHPRGRGELCLRTHEALFFGLPLLVAQAPRIALPAGHERIFVESLQGLPSRGVVLDFYTRRYRPEAAAELLQDAAALST